MGKQDKKSLNKKKANSQSLNKKNVKNTKGVKNAKNAKNAKLQKPKGGAKKVIAAILAVAVVGGAAAAAYPYVRDNFLTPDVTIEMPQTSLELVKGEIVRLVATASNGEEIVWTSSDEAVATVNGGKVKGIAEGTATITASCGDVTKTCTVTVIDVNLTLDKTTATVERGETLTLTATAEKEGELKWASSNDEVLSVKDGVITAKKEGTATVTVTYGSTACKATCEVTVVWTNKPADYEEIMNGAEGDTCLPNPGKFVEWHDQGWVAGNVTMTRAEYMNGTAYIGYTGVTDACWFGMQIFYKNAANVAGKSYELSFDMTSEQEGEITVNGTVVNLKKGENHVVVYYVENGNNASLSMQMGVNGGTTIPENNISIKNLTFTEFTAVALETPTAVAIGADRVVTITDNNGDKATEYQLTFLQNGEKKYSASVANGGKIDNSFMEDGEYEVTVVAVGTGKYLNSAASGVLLTYKVENGGVSYTIEAGGSEAALANPGKYYYWTEFAGIENAKYDRGTVSFDIVAGGNWYSNQIFYKNPALTQGQRYTLKANIHSTTSGSISLNGTVLTLVEGDNPIEIRYNETGDPSFSMQMAPVNGETDITEGTFTITNITWEEFVPVVTSGVKEGSEADAVDAPGMFVYWTEFEGIANAKSENGDLTFDVVNGGNWYSNQIFYKEPNLTIGGKYKLTFKLTSTAAGHIRINGQNTDIVVGENLISVEYTETETGSSLNIQMGIFWWDDGEHGDVNITEGTFTISDMQYTYVEGGGGGGAPAWGTDPIDPETIDRTNAEKVSMEFADAYADVYLFFWVKAQTADMSTAEYVRVNGTRSSFLEIGDPTPDGARAIRMNVGDNSKDYYVFDWYNANDEVIATAVYDKNATGGEAQTGTLINFDDGEGMYTVDKKGVPAAEINVTYTDVPGGSYKPMYAEIATLAAGHNTFTVTLVNNGTTDVKARFDLQGTTKVDTSNGDGSGSGTDACNLSSTGGDSWTDLVWGGTTVTVPAQGTVTLTIKYTSYGAQGAVKNLLLFLDTARGEGTYSGNVTVKDFSFTGTDAPAESGGGTAIENGDEGKAVDTAGSFIEWHDQNWCGSNVTVTKAEYVNGEAHISYEGATTKCWYGMQVFYENVGHVTGNTYKLSVDINSAQAGDITINGKVVTLIVGDNHIEFEYVEPAPTENIKGASLSIQMGTEANSAVIAANTIVIKNLTFAPVGGEEGGETGGEETPVAKAVTMKFDSMYNDTYFFFWVSGDVDMTAAKSVKVNGETSVFLEVGAAAGDGSYPVRMNVGNADLAEYTFEWYNEAGQMIATGSYTQNVSGGEEGGEEGGETGGGETPVAKAVTMKFDSMYNDTYFFFWVSGDVDMTAAKSVKVNGETSVFLEVGAAAGDGSYPVRMNVGNANLAEYTFEWYNEAGQMIATGSYTQNVSGGEEGGEEGGETPPAQASFAWTAGSSATFEVLESKPYFVIAKEYTATGYTEEQILAEAGKIVYDIEEINVHTDIEHEKYFVVTETSVKWYIDISVLGISSNWYMLHFEGDYTGVMPDAAERTFVLNGKRYTMGHPTNPGWATGLTGIYVSDPFVATPVRAEIKAENERALYVVYGTVLYDGYTLEEANAKLSATALDLQYNDTAAPGSGWEYIYPTFVSGTVNNDGTFTATYDITDATASIYTSHYPKGADFKPTEAYDQSVTIGTKVYRMFVVPGSEAAVNCWGCVGIEVKEANQPEFKYTSSALEVRDGKVVFILTGTHRNYDKAEMANWVLDTEVSSGRVVMPYTYTWNENGTFEIVVDLSALPEASFHYMHAGFAAQPGNLSAALTTIIEGKGEVIANGYKYVLGEQYGCRGVTVTAVEE